MLILAVDDVAHDSRCVVEPSARPVHLHNYPIAISEPDGAAVWSAVLAESWYSTLLLVTQIFLCSLIGNLGKSPLIYFQILLLSLQFERVR